MKTATTPYIQEEQRRVGAVPKIKAEIRPFDFDFGLRFDLGTFVNCSCPGTGELLLDSGYVTSGSWISDILQTYMGQLTAVVPSCTNLSNYSSSALYLRTASSYGAVNGLAWTEVEWGSSAPLDFYFQVKIEFIDFVRVWAVDLVGDADAYTVYAIDGGSDEYLSYAIDPEFPGRLDQITMSGLLEIGEEDIIDCGNLIASRPAFFHDIHGETHTLTLDNRDRQWIPGHQNFLMADGLWYGKEIRIYTGFELPTGNTSWVLQYVGRIRDIRDISHSFTGKHQVKIFSSLLLHEILTKEIGAPAAWGGRQPFMAGYYKARADLISSADPYLGGVIKAGSGSAQMVVLGTPYNDVDVGYLVQAETTGEISAATFRWSVDFGASWEKSGIVSTSSVNPFRLRDGVSIYFVPGTGTDLVAGDWFYFGAHARRTTYQIAGAPFQAFTNIYFNGSEIFNVSYDVNNGLINLVGPSGFVDARIVKSATSNPVDIIQAILAEVGLTDYIDEVSFANAKQELADYQIGVRFEGVAAWKAIQTICVACLIFFWIDSNKIYVAAYTGD